MASDIGELKRKLSLLKSGHLIAPLAGESASNGAFSPSINSEPPHNPQTKDVVADPIHLNGEHEGKREAPGEKTVIKMQEVPVQVEEKVGSEEKIVVKMQVPGQTNSEVVQHEQKLEVVLEQAAIEQAVGGDVETDSETQQRSPIIPECSTSNKDNERDQPDYQQEIKQNKLSQIATHIIMAMFAKKQPDQATIQAIQQNNLPENESLQVENRAKTKQKNQVKQSSKTLKTIQIISGIVITGVVAAAILAPTAKKKTEPVVVSLSLPKAAKPLDNVTSSKLLPKPTSLNANELLREPVPSGAKPAGAEVTAVKAKNILDSNQKDPVVMAKTFEPPLPLTQIENKKTETIPAKSTLVEHKKIKKHHKKRVEAFIPKNATSKIIKSYTPHVKEPIEQKPMAPELVFNGQND